MKKKLFISVMMVLFSNIIFCQEKINLTNINYDKTIYIFSGFRPNIIKCDITGSTEIDDVYKNKTLAPPFNSTFYVHSKITRENKTMYIIQFRRWSNSRGFSKESKAIENLTKRSTYNFISDDTTKNQLKGVNTFNEKKAILNNMTMEAFF